MLMRTLLMMMMTLLALGAPLQAGVWSSIGDALRWRSQSEPPSIRILLIHDAQSINLEVKGKYSLYDPYTGEYMSSRFVGKNRTIQAMSDGLKWGEAFPGLYQIKIVPETLDTITVVNGSEYEGNMYVYDIGGTVSVVNEVPIEHFVSEMLAKYQGQELQPETLSALAIAIRTNAYYQASKPKNTYWAIDASKVDYRGDIALHEEIKEALHVTRHMIMSQTSVYEGMATPFAAQLGSIPEGTQAPTDVKMSTITLDEANAMAQKGAHAAQILSKAFAGTTIMLIPYK